MMTLAAEMVELAIDKEVKIAVAESCTGGMIATAITDVAGASKMFDRGFVTYSNEAKSELLGVDSMILETHGAVSEQTAKEMVEGVLENSKADLALAVTGIAGPKVEGEVEEKPVGLVYIAIGWRGEKVNVVKKELCKTNSRDSIRKESTEISLEMLKEALQNYL